MNRNDLYFFRTQKYKDREEIERDHGVLKKHFQEATFPTETIDSFKDLLEKIGEHPIIVRSSSYLEDSFGLAFSGKYESVFLPNQGDLDTRFDNFLQAVKQVLASMYTSDPILYRRQHGLLDYNEQMAMVVQKVVGKIHGHYFFPFAAGVMFSINSYRWNQRIRPEEGLVRIVFGLGTRAVDRVGSDYPRMIPLSHPELRPEIGASQIVKYSQKNVDLLNLKKGCFETVALNKVLKEVEHPDYYYGFSSLEDGDVKAPLYKKQDQKVRQSCTTFENLIKKSPFIPLVRKVLNRLKEAYGRPVDVEFAWDGEKLYILQCRTLSIRKEVGDVVLPKEIKEAETLFKVHNGITSNVIQNIEYVVYVDPKSYNRMKDAASKSRIARIVGAINHRLYEKRFILLGPGRWGSNDINLGVQIRYGDINNALLLAEIAFSQDGFTPEVSYGTHFFQDLVEGDIAILPIYPDRDDCFAESFLKQAKNRLTNLIPDASGFEDIVHVVHIPSVRGGMYIHVFVDGVEQEGIAYYAEFSERLE